VKKILVVINRFGVGGAERLVVDDINEMLRRGIDVRLLTLVPERLSNSIALDCCITSEKWKTINFRNLLSISSWFSFISFLKEYKPDVVMSHLWYSNTISRIVSRICGIKIHLAFEHNVYDLVKTRKMFFIDRLLQGLSTKIVAVSETVKESLMRHRISHNRILVVHNGIDTSRYLNIQIDKLKGELNIKDEFVYIFIGRFINQKGVDILLNAFVKVKTGHLFLVGDGTDKDKLQQLAVRLDIQKRVSFLGIRQDIPNLLALADCFVLPSRYEGLPMVLIEAIVSGKAIIISDFESGKELIKDGENGLIVPMENPEMLAQAMFKMQDDKKLRVRLGNQALLEAQRFSIKHHVDTLINISNAY